METVLLVVALAVVAWTAWKNHKRILRHQAVLDDLRAAGAEKAGE